MNQHTAWASSAIDDVGSKEGLYYIPLDLLFKTEIQVVCFHFDAGAKENLDSVLVSNFWKKKLIKSNDKANTMLTPG